MKRRILALTLVLCSVFAFILPAYAATPATRTATMEDGSTVIYDDEGYLVISPVRVEEVTAPLAARSGELLLTHGSREAIRYSSSDEVEWRFTVTGNFQYVYGESAECINGFYQTEVNNNNWTMSDKYARPTDNKIVGGCICTYKWLFITTDTVEVCLTITCDVYGNLS